jgi:hypothetical protein
MINTREASSVFSSHNPGGPILIVDSDDDEDTITYVPPQTTSVFTNEASNDTTSNGSTAREVDQNEIIEQSDTEENNQEENQEEDGQENEDDDDDFPEFRAKIPRLHSNPDIKASKATADAAETATEEEVCSICLDPWTNSGVHRLVCLKCGHLFGEGYV